MSSPLRTRRRSIPRRNAVSRSSSQPCKALRSSDGTRSGVDDAGNGKSIAETSSNKRKRGSTRTSGPPHCKVATRVRTSEQSKNDSDKSTTKTSADGAGGQENHQHQQQHASSVKMPAGGRRTLTKPQQSASCGKRSPSNSAALMSPTRVSKRLRLNGHTSLYEGSNLSDRVVPLGSTSASMPSATSSNEVSDGSMCWPGSDTSDEAKARSAAASDDERSGTQTKSARQVGYRLRDATQYQALEYGDVMREAESDKANAGCFLPVIKTVKQESLYCEYDADAADVAFVEEFMSANGLAASSNANNNVITKKNDKPIPVRAQRRAAAAAKDKIKSEANTSLTGNELKKYDSGGNDKETQERLRGSFIESLEQSFSRLEHMLREAIHATSKASGKRRSLIFAHVHKGQAADDNKSCNASGEGETNAAAGDSVDADVLVACDVVEDQVRKRRRCEMEQAGKVFVELDKDMIESLVPFTLVCSVVAAATSVPPKKKRGWPKGKPRGKRGSGAVQQTKVKGEVAVKQKQASVKGRSKRGGKSNLTSPPVAAVATTTAVASESDKSGVASFGYAVYQRWVSLHVEQGPLVHCWQLHPTLEHWRRRCVPLGLLNEVKVE
jgi:hypothetical protein